MPEPGAGEVLIRVSHAGVNFAEVQHRRGTSEPEPEGDVPGLEAAGVVAAVGAGGQRTRGRRPGDGVPAGLRRIRGVRDRSGCVHLSIGDLDPVVAAGAPTVLTTAYGLLAGAGRLTAGDTVLVHAAAGGVGTVAVQIAKALGAGKVFGTVGSADKAAYARQFGYDEVVVRDGFATRSGSSPEGAEWTWCWIRSVGRPAPTASAYSRCSAGWRRTGMREPSGSDPGGPAAVEEQSVRRRVQHRESGPPGAGVVTRFGSAGLDLCSRQEGPHRRHRRTAAVRRRRGSRPPSHRREPRQAGPVRLIVSGCRWRGGRRGRRRYRR